MSDESTPVPRRSFFRALAQGALALGGMPAAGLAAENPFAYDVSRFSRTDPGLIGWEEIARRRIAGREARRLAIGPGDVVHVAVGDTIERWSATSTLAPLQAGAKVTCLAVAADGIVIAGLRHRIITFDADGRSRALWESEDKRSWFSGLAIAGLDFWISDSGLRLIWRCDRAGQPLGRIGVRQSERNVPGFVVPSPYLDVRLHPDGLLRVNNPGRHRFEAYTTDGDFEAAWGRPSAAIAGFCGCCNPIALAVLPDGRMVTAEKGLPRVKIYGLDGAFESVVAPTESFADNRRRGAEAGDSLRAGLDVAVDAQGQIHILDRTTGEVRVMRAKRRT